MRCLMKNIAGLGVIVALAACSTTASDETTASTASTGSQVETSSVQMEVTDIDYRSVKTDIPYKVSYSFPDNSGRFSVRVTGASGTLEPVGDTSDVLSVNDDVASSIICKSESGESLQKLTRAPTYVVADRAYQSNYKCT